MKKKVKIVSGIVIVCLAVTTVGVVLHFVKDKDKIAAMKNRISTVELTKMDLTDSISATGEIESKQTRSVSADINGVTIKEMLVSVGDQVKKGDSLVKFDKSDLKEALSDAKSELADTRASADREIASAKEKYADALDTQSYDNSKAASSVSKAEKSLKEAKAALKKAKNSKAPNASESIRTAEEAYKQAESELEKAKESRTSTARQNKSTVSQAKSALESAQANADKSIKEAKKRVEEAKENLEACAITAPIDGIITAVNAESGDTYSGGTLVQIDDVSGYRITTSVDEYDISDIKTGQRVVILTEATGDDELEGKTTFVAPSKGSTSSSTSANVTGNVSVGGSSSDSSGYEVIIDVTTADERLKLGMTARCSIILREKNDVYAVPYDAVNELPDGSCYITVADGTSDKESNPEDNNSEEGKTESNKADNSDLRQITVTKGMDTDYYVEITGDSLEEGMKVVVPSDEISTDSSSSESMDGFPGFGGMNGGSGMPDGAPGGMLQGMPGGAPGGSGGRP